MTDGSRPVLDVVHEALEAAAPGLSLEGNGEEGRDAGRAEAWVELRVHGVSGTPPESMLGTPHVEQVAGDDYSRYFTTDPKPTDRELEGYHWGRFTSGTWRHALTLLFLPFGMVNAAPFMLPRGAGPLRTIALALFRLLGLLLTGLFSFALGLILIDLIGWRWSPSSNLFDGFSTGTVLPVTVLLAAAGMGLLSVLNQPGFIRTPTLVDDRDRWPRPSLRRDLYRPTVGSRLLRRLHLATGLAVIALLADLARTGTDPTDDGGPLRVAVLLALLVIVVMVVLMGDPTRTSPRDEPATSTADKLRRAAGIPAVLLATVAVLARGGPGLRRRRPARPPGWRPGRGAGTTRPLRRRRRQPDAARACPSWARWPPSRSCRFSCTTAGTSPPATRRPSGRTRGG